jgi:Caspase domain
MRRALIVGINDYPTSPLNGCINDARKIQSVLRCNEDQSPNFDCRLITSAADSTRPALIDAINRLFADKADIALLYFSGHGLLKNLGGFLVTSDAKRHDEGIAMSPAQEVIIILDCCHSGAFGAYSDAQTDSAHLREGMSVLTASRDSQVAVERGGAGIFTSLIYDALCGGAADILGKVSVASVYAYVDAVLGAWEQRPMFKSHVSRSTPLRSCCPQVPLEILRLLPAYFPTPDYVYPLDPSYEPESQEPDTEHSLIFGHFQQLRDARLLVPNGEQHLYHAAMNSQSCKLTHLGCYFWRLAQAGRI